MIAERIAWEVEAAPVIEQLRLKKRRPVKRERDVLAKRPVGDPVVDAVVRAIDELGTCRGPAISELAPIPILAIWSYWERRGLDATAVRIRTHAVLVGDRVYRQLQKKAS